MHLEETEAVSRARKILFGGPVNDIGEALRLARQLASERRFDYARKVLSAAHAVMPLYSEHFTRVAVKLASYYMRDESLPLNYRLGCALTTLKRAVNLRTTTDQEVLGLTGAISKRMWEADGQILHLHGAMAYYRRGLEAGVESDQGYNAINIAYILDVIASREDEEARRAGGASAGAAERREEARRIRERIVAELPPELEKPDSEWLAREFWFQTTVAEAFFGLRRYEEALEWLLRARALDPPEWEVEATARQLGTLARLQDSGDAPQDAGERPEALRVISEFVGKQVTGVDFLGKIGLGLSGGGFRASLFHIGVLARLAELDVLRRVEVLSCVSGGSIIGAHYYLEVRRLLESKTDAEITREDYIKLVERVSRDFLKGVQRNVRTRVFSEIKNDLKMIFVPSYSAALRLGELFESELFSRVADGEGTGPRWMDRLSIFPKGETEGFTLERNWRRTAKVPELIVNATSLNTGRNWQFTARGMGESAWSMRTDNTEGSLYKFKDYSALETDRVRLGHAVAASACVPGLFGPVTLSMTPRDIYGVETLVRLVDGGVYDNQGIVGLNDRGCSVLLISDASGQFTRTNSPGGGMLGGAMRSSEIQGRIVREAVCEELDSRAKSGLIRNYMLLHLRRDLDELDETSVADVFDGHRDVPLTGYGISKEVQAQLASIRTDLDSFCDVEAYALMTSGYRMTEYEFEHGTMCGFAGPPPDTHRWGFLAVEEMMRVTTDAGLSRARQRRFRMLLAAAGYRAGKVARLLPSLRYFLYATLVAALAALVYTMWNFQDTILFVWTWATTLRLTAFFVLTAALVWILARVGDLGQMGVGMFFAFYGSVFAWLHLRITDPMYLKHGSLGMFLDRQEPAGRRDAHAARSVATSPPESSPADL